MPKERLATQRLRGIGRRSPATVLLGPRQVGKSTLARLAFPDHTFFDLEDPRDEARVRADPLFALSQQTHVVVDEAQRLPALFPILRSYLDANARRRVVLLGSASPGLVRSISESLTGRAVFFDLAGISCLEEEPARLWRLGGFPRLHWTRPRAVPEEWYPSYLRTTLERDIPQLGLTLPPARARALLTLVANGQGSMLNLSELGGPLGVSYHTVAAALAVLEGVFLLRRLPPFVANIGKRLVKSPKVYVRDTGILHSLLGMGWTRASQLAYPKVGASWETFCIEQLISHAVLVDPASEAFFFRTQTGIELDLLLRFRGELLAFEMKLGVTARDTRPMKTAMADLGIRRGYQVNAGEDLVALEKGIWVGGIRQVIEAAGMRP
jgi:predicted AAA+ superfamily ATPase